MNNVKLDEAKLLELGRDRATRVNVGDDAIIHSVINAMCCLHLSIKYEFELVDDFFITYALTASSIDSRNLKRSRAEEESSRTSTSSGCHSCEEELSFSP